MAESSKTESIASSGRSFILKPPKGMNDYTPLENLKRDWVKTTIEQVFLRHGVGRLDTPVMERREILYAKASDETSKQIYDIADRSERQSETAGMEKERLSQYHWQDS